MHKGWKSGMVAVEGNCFIVQSLCSSMMATMTRKEHLESVQSTKQLKKIRRRFEMPKKKDCIIMTAEMLFPLDLDGHFLDSFPYDSTDVLQ